MQYYDRFTNSKLTDSLQAKELNDMISTLEALETSVSCCSQSHHFKSAVTARVREWK